MDMGRITAWPVGESISYDPCNLEDIFKNAQRVKQSNAWQNRSIKHTLHCQITSGHNVVQSGEQIPTSDKQVNAPDKRMTIEQRISDLFSIIPSNTIFFLLYFDFVTSNGTSL
jgi:hypothetical protein